MYTVLIVDDEPLVRCSIAYMIGTGLPDVKIIGEASNGRDALECVGSLFPDIVLVDIRMPVMDGIEMIGKLKDARPQTQCIIISGHADFEYARQALHFEVKAYVLKPIKQSELCEAIGECIKRLSGDRADTPPETDIIKDMTRFIQDSFSQPLTLEWMAERFNFSPKYISSLIKLKTGKSFTDYLLDLRIATAVEMLTKTDLGIKEIAAQVGYDDHQYFHRVFKKKTGLTPRQYRQK